jgi:hypothetical protein
MSRFYDAFRQHQRVLKRHARPLAEVWRGRMGHGPKQGDAASSPPGVAGLDFRNGEEFTQREERNRREQRYHGRPSGKKRRAAHQDDSPPGLNTRIQVFDEPSRRHLPDARLQYETDQTGDRQSTADAVQN